MLLNQPAGEEELPAVADAIGLPANSPVAPVGMTHPGGEIASNNRRGRLCEGVREGRCVAVVNQRDEAAPIERRGRPSERAFE